MIKKTLPYQHNDVQTAGAQYLEDLATGYWYSEVLFTAVEMGLFDLIGKNGAAIEDLSVALDAKPQGVQRLLQALERLGLVTRGDRRYFNTKLSSSYLIRGKEHYQGDSILWRKFLRPRWQGLKECVREGGRVDYGTDVPSEKTGRIQKYIQAMDGIAKIKADEIVRRFEDRGVKGTILDVGAGSGALGSAFLEHFPETKAVFIDLPDVLDETREMQFSRGLNGRAEYYGANILEPWPVGKQGFDLVILSNILHAYSEAELPHILRSASDCLTHGGILLIHDFFWEHCPGKAALSDLNMFINTYNGKVFSGNDTRGRLLDLGLFCTELLPLKTDTGVLFASKDKKALDSLCLDPIDLLVSSIRALGFNKVYRIDTDDIHITDWAELRCRFGCDRYGKPHCPPNSPSCAKTREVVKDYHQALLLQGEPPTGTFQRAVVQAERTAFKAGFHKAFSYWSGPCSLCESCKDRCTNTLNSRPSMESAGIDVFETARRAGACVRTLSSKDDFVKYFGLLLLE